MATEVSRASAKLPAGTGGVQSSCCSSGCWSTCRYQSNCMGSQELLKERLLLSGLSFQVCKAGSRTLQLPLVLTHCRCGFRITYGFTDLNTSSGKLLLRKYRLKLPRDGVFISGDAQNWKRCGPGQWPALGRRWHWVTSGFLFWPTWCYKPELMSEQSLTFTVVVGVSEHTEQMA